MSEPSGQSPSDRNKAAITEQLKLIFPSSTGSPSAESAPLGPLHVFEVGSGTGIHVLHFAAELPHVHWHPSDYNKSTVQCHSGEYVHVKSILDTVANKSWKLPSNVAEPIFFDVTASIEESQSQQGRKATFDGVLNINMLHIAPWAVSVGLFHAAGYLLKAGGLLVLYGAFAVDGILEPDSNVEFDLRLRAKDSEWGVRDVRDLKVLAVENGLHFRQMIEMPSNNKMLVFVQM